MEELLAELQILINKATSDYKNRVWSRYDIYCFQFNKILTSASKKLNDIAVAPIDVADSPKSYGTHEVYDMLANRIKLKEVIDRASLLLESFNGSSPLSVTLSTAQSTSKSNDNIELICNQFCSIVREFRRRSDNGAILEIDHVNDVLYLFKSLLRLYYDTVVEDIWENSEHLTQLALLMPKEGTALIIKKTYKGITDSELTNDFMEALSRYHQTMEYSNIYYFIYDAELRISQPFNLENELNALNKSLLTIKAFIRPLN